MENKEDKVWINNVYGMDCVGDEIRVLSYEESPYEWEGTKHKKVFDIGTGKLKSERTYESYSFWDIPLSVLAIAPLGIPLLVPSIRRNVKKRLSRYNNFINHVHTDIWSYNRNADDYVGKILGEEIKRVDVYLGGIEEAERETGKKAEPIKLDSSEKFIRAHSQKELKIDALGLGANAIVNYSFLMGIAKGTPVVFEETKT
jgi:hypothetical protein